MNGMLHRFTPSLPVDMNAGRGRSRTPTLVLITKLIYILYSLEVGALLLCLPWLRFWENNYLLYLYPQILTVAANPFFKGFVLGLGIVNILLGIQEIANVRRLLRHNNFSR